MEPLSAAGSILAVLGAIKSCKRLLDFFREQTAQASDLRCYTTSLEALHSTLENIRSLLIKHNLQTEQTLKLFSNITRFLVDISAAEKKLNALSRTIGRGGVRSVWMRLEWSMSTKRWLEGFFKKVVIWQMIFASDLQAIQL